MFDHGLAVPATAISYLAGTLCSGLAGVVGMNVAVRANVRTAAAAMNGLNPALRVAFSSGSVMGVTVVGIGLLGVTILYLIFQDISAVAGFGFGASSIALFARVGGGIFTKAADVGSDLVGKVEAGIPEDDPRNPGVIADNVGDNVGDVAGMGADLFESYVGSIISAIALSASAVALAVGGQGAEWNSPQSVFPMLLAGSGIVAAILGTFIVRSGEQANFEKLLWALRYGIFGAGGLLIVFAAILTITLTDNWYWFGCVVAGLLAGTIIGVATEYYTSYSYKPTQKVSESSQTGAATVIISGIATGMMSTLIPVICVSVAILLAYWFAGFYGVALAGVGLLSTLGITLATDAYGPVADNAGGIAEQAQLEPQVRERTDALDALGNTTAATGKGFAIGSAALTALALLAAYSVSAGLIEIDADGRLVEGSLGINLLQPPVLVGLIIGAMLPFIFSALTMQAVGRAAQGIVDEVRRQFREIPGLMEGEARPDSARCVDISTRGALREMILPGVLAGAGAHRYRLHSGRGGPGRPAHRGGGRRVYAGRDDGQRRGRLGQRQEVCRAGQLRRQGFRLAQGGGGGRCGGRPVQRHLRPVAEHPAETDGGSFAGLRPGLPGGHPADNPHLTRPDPPPGATPGYRRNAPKGRPPAPDTIGAAGGLFVVRQRRRFRWCSAGRSHPFILRQAQDERMGTPLPPLQT